MKGLLIVVAVLLIATIKCKLYQAVAFIAPGARYHINDLYDAKTYQKQWGQITPVGLRQQENLGKLFRKQYVEANSFLSSNFNRDEYEIYSLTLNRTIQSGLANLYGMYPLGQGQVLENVDPKYRIPPYAYKNDSSQQKYALLDGQLIKAVKYDSALIEACANQQIEIDKNIKQQIADYNQMVLTYTPFLRKAANTFGLDSNSMNFTKLSALYDTVNVDRYLGKTLPSGFSQDDFNNLQHLYNWYTHFTRSFNLSKAVNTKKIEKILGTFDNRVKNIAGVALKWSTISVDILDIVALQNDLNISSALCIEEIYRKGTTQALNCQQGAPFASSIVFQLHSDNTKDFYVRIRDNGKYINLCEAKNRDCSYPEWRSRAQKIMISNAQAICGKTQQKQNMEIVVE